MSLGDGILAALIVLFGGVGTYLMLPHRHSANRPQLAYGAGAIAAGVGLLLFVFFWSPPGPFLATVFFYIFSLTAVISGLLSITSRDPINSALWFASVVLSTAGLFLLAEAPFLAAGTIIVYAGAIIVTFLFVIMLAQMEGKAVYDRAARSPLQATLAGFLIFWGLIYSLSVIRTGPHASARADRVRIVSEEPLPRIRDFRERYFLQPNSANLNVVARGLRPTSSIAATTKDGESRAKPNVAGLGESLYTDHLVTVGVTGVLLFIALIGAVAISSPPKPGPA
jgi:NADH-quinone oxidoreductase subunit J